MRGARLIALGALGALCGVMAGLLGFAFLESLDWATGSRGEHGWLIWLLPVGGLLIGGAYHSVGGAASGGTSLVARQSVHFTEPVPRRMIPLIFGGTIGGHLVGASVGREGAAVQMAAAATDGVARHTGVTADDRSRLITAAIAAGFGATFGLPVGGTVFALQVSRRFGEPVTALLALGAAVLGDLTVNLLGHQHTAVTPTAAPPWDVVLVLQLLAIGVGVGLAARAYVHATEIVRHRSTAWLRVAALRPAVGGLAMLVLALVAGRRYLGLSLPMYHQAVDGGGAEWYEPLLKLLFTAIALGTGWVGGEVVALFVIGSTLGASLATGLGAPSALAARAGAVAAFNGASGTALAGLAMSVELFGWRALAPTLLVAAGARLGAGRPDLYRVADAFRPPAPVAAAGP
jgi:H+/Cl- antiporter ClcA